MSQASAAALAAALLLAPRASYAANACTFGDGFESRESSSCALAAVAPPTSWQIQFSGTLDTSLDVELYDIDLVETSLAEIAQLNAAGRIVVCYFSAGTWESYRPDEADIPLEVRGNALDPPFADERWLDIRRIDVLGPVMARRMDLATAKGCDAVDPDNVDGYTNSTGFPLTHADQLAYNRWIADAAHARGLAVGLKNDLDQIADLLPSFDFAINEQCFQFSECALLMPFVAAGKAVLGIEYELDASAFCPSANAMNFDFLKKNIALDAFRQACR